MTLALMSSGGKDATLALDRARRTDLDVRYYATVLEAAAERVPTHGTRRELIERQARALGLETVTTVTSPLEPFEVAYVNLLRTLKQRGVTGIVFGNVHLDDVRAWFEERVRSLGLDHLEPLWGEPGVEVAWEVIERGYRALILSVQADGPVARLLGRELDADTLTEISCLEDVDPCGEHGEYHTFVFDGPEFREAIHFTRGPVVESGSHRMIDLVPLRLRRARTRQRPTA